MQEAKSRLIDSTTIHIKQENTDEETSNKTIDEVIEEIGIGKFQIILLFVCGLGYAADSIEIFTISFLLPIAKDEWNLTNTEVGYLGSFPMFGMFIGALFWGLLGDTLGRKIAFMCTVLFTAFFGLASAFAPNFWSLVLLRFFVGFGVGGNAPIDFSMFSEFVPTTARGKYLVWLGIFFIVGQAIVSGLAWLVIPLLGWRWFLVIASIPFFILAFCRGFVPESPRFLMTKLQKDKAKEILIQLARRNQVQINENFKLVSDSALIEKPEHEKMIQKFIHQIREMKKLLSKEIRRTTILLWVYWFCIAFGSNIIVFFPMYFKMKGLSEQDVYMSTFFSALGNFGSFLIMLVLINKVGRRYLLGFSLLAGVVMIALFSFSTEMILLITIAAIANLFIEAGWVVLYVYTPEVYPTFIRASGMGIASSIAKFASGISPFIGAMMLNTSIEFSLFTFASFLLIAGLSAFGFSVETKDRKLSDYE